MEQRASCKDCDAALTKIGDMWLWVADLTAICDDSDPNEPVLHTPKICERCSVPLEDYPTLIYPNEEQYDGDARWCLDCFNHHYSELDDDGPTNADYVKATR